MTGRESLGNTPLTGNHFSAFAHKRAIKGDILHLACCARLEFAIIRVMPTACVKLLLQIKVGGALPHKSSGSKSSNHKCKDIWEISFAASAGIP